MDCHKHCAAPLKWARGLLICVIGFVGLGSVFFDQAPQRKTIPK